MTPLNLLYLLGFLRYSLASWANSWAARVRIPIRLEPLQIDTVNLEPQQGRDIRLVEFARKKTPPP